MALSVIGAGLGRTATLSLKHALELLGVGRCYHMMEVINDPDRIDHWVEATLSDKPDWDGVFDGFGATVDWPAASYWRELAAYYPDAKVILSVRDADRWFDSTQNTIFHKKTVDHMEPGTPRRAMVERAVFRMFDGRIHDREHCKAVYERHNRTVIDAIPPERLLVYHVGSGWEPLCAFLGVPIPSEPYPQSNDGEEFQARLDERVQMEG